MYKNCHGCLMRDLFGVMSDDVIAGDARQSTPVIASKARQSRPSLVRRWIATACGLAMTMGEYAVS